MQVNFVGNKLVEHPQTQAYRLVIQDSIIIQNITKTIRDGGTSDLPAEAKVCFKLEQCFLILFYHFIFISYRVPGHVRFLFDIFVDI